MKRNIWTINVLTGIPEKHEAEVKGCTAISHEEGFKVTRCGGFFLRKKDAESYNTSQCLSILESNKRYADRLKEKSGLCLV